MFTVEQMKEMIALQEQLEIRIGGENWRENDDHDYALAIHMECAEIIDNLGWKWWKNTMMEPNWDQVCAELIDVWHFALGHMLLANEDHDRLAQEVHAQVLTAAEQATRFRDQYSIMDMTISLGYHMVNSRQFPLTTFIMICECAQLAPKELFKLYLGKNVLNHFRQENGYKEGTYKKMWRYANQLMADTDVLTELLKESEILGALTYEKIYSRLTHVYAIQ